MPRCEELIGTSWTAGRPKRSLTSDERVGPVVGSTARKKDMGGWIVKRIYPWGLRSPIPLSQ